MATVERPRIIRDTPRVRPRIHYRPRWEGPFENYARAFSKRNHWRVKHIHPTEEDAVQECGIVFTKCVNRYFGTVNNPAWFMGLYKVALMNQFNVFAVKDGQRRSVEQDAPADSEWQAQVSVDHNLGPLGHELRAYKDEIREVLTVLANAPRDAIASIMGARSEVGLGRRIRTFTGVTDPFPRRVVAAYCQLRLEAPQAAMAALEDLQRILQDEVSWHGSI